MILTLCPGCCWWRPRSRLIGKFYKWGKWLATCEHSGQWSLWSWRHYIIDITAHTSAVSYLVTRVTLTYCVCRIITCTFHFHSAIHAIDADRGKQWWPPPIHYTFIHYTLYIIHTEPISDHQPWPGQSIMSHIEYKIGPSGLWLIGWSIVCTLSRPCDCRPGHYISNS